MIVMIKLAVLPKTSPLTVLNQLMFVIYKIIFIMKSGLHIN